MPIAELNANRDDIDYVIDLSAEAAEYGLTADMASHLARRPTSIDFHGVFIDNFGIDEINTVGEDNTFVHQSETSPLSSAISRPKPYRQNVLSGTNHIKMHILHQPNRFIGTK